MNGDFSRLTFDKKKHYSGVLMQQGRVQVDADWNEQQAINLYRTETGVKEIIGPTGVPKPQYGGGFMLSVASGSLNISPGRIYVHGILCENEKSVALTQQTDLPQSSGALVGFNLPTQSGLYLAYLDVWQRHLTAIDDPDIREKALGGPDTATRTKTVWQVRLLRVGNLGQNYATRWTLSGSRLKRRATARSSPVRRRRPPRQAPASCPRRLATVVWKINFTGSKSIAAARAHRRVSNGRATTVRSSPIFCKSTAEPRCGLAAQDATRFWGSRATSGSKPATTAWNCTNRRESSCRLTP